MTNITEIVASSILTKPSGFIGEYDFTLNPYRGCSFGCRYCYAAKHQYDKKLDDTWGGWMQVKINAPELLEKIARSGKLANASIYMASVTDPYLPQEKQFRITEQCLKILVSFPPRRLVIQTRGPLIERDIHLLKSFGDRLIVSFSLPTDQDEVRKILEPTTASIHRRILTIRRLFSEAIRVYATIAPLLPCNPVRLASLIADSVEGVIISDLHDDGAGGRNTPMQAMKLIRENDWGYCLEPDYAQKVATTMRKNLALKVYIGKEGFSGLAYS